MSPTKSSITSIDSGSTEPVVQIHQAPTVEKRPGGSWLNGIVWLLFLAATGSALYYFRGMIFGEEKTHSVDRHNVVLKEVEPWHGVVTLLQDAQTAMGITTTPVVQQKDPILLPILGTTSHDETKLSKISPLFKGRVEKVYVSVGDFVTKGMPLVDLYSADLAQAKTTFEIEKTQWEYVRKLLEVRTQLRSSNSISEQLLLDTQNDELRQRHEFDIAKEKLLLYGLTDEEIDGVPKEQGAQRARLSVRAPADGVVISRNAVAGNIYDENDVILVIAPNDHLWVWGNVFERDLGVVHLGQKWEVKFNFLHDRIAGTVEYISPNVDPRAHAVKIRSSIPNPEGSLKADMLVDGYLQIAPEDNFVAIPRIAMVVFDGRSYAFTRVPGQPDRFVRHLLNVVHEREDRVILRNGLSPGEDVVVLGSLIMQQLYEEGEVLAHGHGARSVGDRD